MAGRHKASSDPIDGIAPRSIHRGSRVLPLHRPGCISATRNEPLPLFERAGPYTLVASQHRPGAARIIHAPREAGERSRDPEPTRQSWLSNTWSMSTHSSDAMDASTSASTSAVAPRSRKNRFSAIAL